MADNVEMIQKIDDIIFSLGKCAKEGKSCKKCKEKDECRKFMRAVLVFLMTFVKGLHMTKKPASSLYV